MFFLGIDGGGSQTRAWLSDEAGNILGQGLGGPSNPCAQSSAMCIQQLEATIQGALASKPEGPITAAHLGVAGAGDPSAKKILNSVVARLFDRVHTRVSISDDLRIAHAGALAGHAGIALVAGTGSACYGVDLKGKEILTGGWGDLIDDAGSGTWIGLRALQICVRQADGRASGHDLQHHVLQFLQIDSIDQIKPRIHLIGLPREERAKLAPVVCELARSGDPSAERIVREAVCELTLLVQRNFEGLGLPEARLVLLGGLNKSRYFSNRLKASIQANTPGVEIVQPRLSATAGAVLLAMLGAGFRVNASILNQLNRSVFMSAT
jgi:N-acetylglucosamine kinase-like BadF-type ATPase